MTRCVYELEQLKKIIDRGCEMARDFGRDDVADNRPTVTCIVMSCHEDCVPLQLDMMLDGSDVDFAHDFFGILGNYDLMSKSMRNLFHPRFAADQREGFAA